MSGSLKRRLKRIGDALLGGLAIVILKTIRLFDRDAIANFGGHTMRWIGPWLPEHRTGRANLKAAFPEKSDRAIEHILRGVWDNLGRVGGEFAHLDRLWDHDPAQPELARVAIPPDSIERFTRLRDDGKPALIFGAHLANWEIPALAATAHGMDAAVLYRRPNIGDIDRAIRELRSTSRITLIHTGLDAPVKLAELLERGAHVGMLVDQYYVRGVPVTFFGQRTRANPLLARLARHFDCPIHGVRVIRLPGGRFRGEITEAIEPARDPGGGIDVAGTMQIITSIVEGWVREHPDQWLWLHQRWRDE
jgi:KDO2-lipid IV(A) lauroyltransferase